MLFGFRHDREPARLRRHWLNPPQFSEVQPTPTHPASTPFSVQSPITCLEFICCGLFSKFPSNEDLIGCLRGVRRVDPGQNDDESVRVMGYMLTSNECLISRVLTDQIKTNDQAANLVKLIDEVGSPPSSPFAPLLLPALRSFVPLCGVAVG